jgi:Tfp pilus assembly protein PilE
LTARTRIIIIAAAVIGGSLLLCFGFLAGVAVTGYRAAMHEGNGMATLQNLKTIAAVEAQYFNSHNRTFGTLDQLINEQLLSSKFRGHPAVADGYVFTLTLAPKDGSSWYKITADPQDDETGTNHFYLDSSDHLIRVNRDRQAGPTDPSF